MSPEIREKITAALQAAGVTVIGHDDSTSFVSSLHRDGLPLGPRIIVPTERSDAISIAVITAESVQKFNLCTPYNHRDWMMAGRAEPYSYPEEMVALVKAMTKEKRGCW